MLTVELHKEEPRPGLSERLAARLHEAGARGVGNNAAFVVCSALGGVTALWQDNVPLALLWAGAGVMQAHTAFIIHGFQRLCDRYEERIKRLDQKAG